MQDQRLWQWGSLGLALAVGILVSGRPQSTIEAVPQAPIETEQTMPVATSVFTPVSSSSPSQSSHQVAAVTSAVEGQTVRAASAAQAGSSSTGSFGRNHLSTTLENDRQTQRSETALTRAADMSNGTVKMTMATDGTLHLSGGAFGTSLGTITGSWIVRTLAANGYQAAQVVKIKIDDRITVKNVTSYDYLFAGLPNLTSIEGLVNLDLSSVTSLESLFKEDHQLQQVDFGQTNFTKVQSFQSMFFACSALTKVAGISQWQTASVKDISRMFAGDAQLTTLDLNGWDVSHVTSMFGMFSNCAKLVTLNVADWNTQSLLRMDDAFSGDSALTNLAVGKWNTSNVTDLTRTFTGCTSLTALDIANWDTRRVVSLASTFMGMTNLKSLPVDNWQTARVDSMQLTFYGDSNLTTLPIAKWDTGQVTSLKGTFALLKRLTALPVDNWNTSKVTSLAQTFYGDTGLTALPISRWDVSQVTDMSSVFADCSQLTTLPVANWHTQNVRGLSFAFKGMTNLTTLPIDNWNTSQVTSLGSTFNSVKALTTIPVGNWDTSQVIDMSSTFFNNPQLTSLPIAHWNTSSVTMMAQLFLDCSGLKQLDLGAWNTDKVTNFGYTFGNTALERLDLLGWNTKNAQNYVATFGGGQAPKHILLGPNFNFFNSLDWQLPAPSQVAPYIGKWRSLNDSKLYTSNELMTKYDGKTIAGGFEWATGRTITVKYADAAGNTLAPDTKITGATGEAYHIVPIAIEGYVPDQPDGVQGTFATQDETITLVYSPGKVQFKSVPGKIDFGLNPITGDTEKYGAKYDNAGLVIQDGRLLGSTWSLTAKLAATGFTGQTSTRPLAAVLSYQDRKNGTQPTLTPGAAVQIVDNYQTDAHLGVTILGTESALGALYLKVPTDQALSETYQTTVTWTLGQTVPNR